MVSAPQPGRTDQEIFDHGAPILLLASPRSMTIEEWVQGIAKLTGTRTDWRMVGGYGIVLVLGDLETCKRVQKACLDNWEALVDQYMACTYNFTTRPERSDVVRHVYDLEAP